MAVLAMDHERTAAIPAATGVVVEKTGVHDGRPRTDLTECGDRLARDLHDAVVKQLFITGLTLHRALPFVEANPEATERIEQALQELDGVVREVRNTVFELDAATGPDGGIRRKLLQLGE
jgi:signal transduction histidine kinase